MHIHYLNTDLEIESPIELSLIIEAFGTDVSNLYHGEARSHYLATFEANNDTSNPNSVIQYFCTLIEAFDKRERELCDNCFSKVFDIGYEGGTNHQSYTDEIRAETIQRVSKIGASIRITVYPMNNSCSE